MKRVTLACPVCDHTVTVYVQSESQKESVEAWCATKHAKPVQMTKPAKKE